MQNFYELFADAARHHAARIAIELQHRDSLDSITYDRLREMAERTAAWLAAIGIAAGDRCAILADNDGHWCAAYLGVLRRGAVAVPLDTAYKAAQVETLVRDSGARVVFTSPKYVETVTTARAAANADCRIVLLHGESAEAVSFDAMVTGRMPAPPLPACPARPDDAAVILYTSGTTSDPKGVVLTHANLLAERHGAFSIVRVTETDCILGVLPLFHALAQMANLLLPLSIGARVVFLETVNTTELLRALNERGVTIFACVPQFFYLIHQRVMSEVARRGALSRRLFRVLVDLNGRLRRIGLNVGRLCFAPRARGRRPPNAGAGNRRIAVRSRDRAGPVRPRLQHPPGVRPDGNVGGGNADAPGRPPPRNRRPAAAWRRDPHRTRDNDRRSSS